MKSIPEEFWVLVGIAFVLLALGASVIGLIYSSNQYGNQIAKKCIANRGEWRLVDNRYSQYECRHTGGAN